MAPPGVLHLIAQDQQIGLGHGDQKAQQKGDGADLELDLEVATSTAI